MLSNCGNQGANSRVNTVPVLRKVRCREITGTWLRRGGVPSQGHRPDSKMCKYRREAMKQNHRDKEYMGVSVMISEKMKESNPSKEE